MQLEKRTLDHHSKREGVPEIFYRISLYFAENLFYRIRVYTCSIRSSLTDLVFESRRFSLRSSEMWVNNLFLVQFIKERHETKCLNTMNKSCSVLLCAFTFSVILTSEQNTFVSCEDIISTSPNFPF